MNTPPPDSQNSIMKLVGTLFSIAVIVGVKLGFSYLWGSGSEEASKYQKWDKKFKTSFIKACAKSQMKSIVSQYKLDPKKMDKTQKLLVVDYSSKYCECTTDGVEAAHVIKTRYNTYRGVASVNKENLKAIDEFLKTKKAAEMTGKCQKIALKFFESKI